MGIFPKFYWMWENFRFGSYYGMRSQGANCSISFKKSAVFRFESQRFLNSPKEKLRDCVFWIYEPHFPKLHMSRFLFEVYLSTHKQL